jgi:hypothetical protein
MRVCITPSRRQRWGAPAVILVGLTLGGFACETGVRTPIGDIYWTQFQQQRQAAREEAVARYNYCPEGGCVIRLESVEVQPALPARGEPLQVTIAYTLLTAQDTPIPVTISRELALGGKSLGRVKDTITTQGNGTWSQRVDFSLPAGAPPGLYTMVTRINSPYGSDSKSIQFTVR